MRVPVFTALGWYLGGSLMICVRLRASSLDCRMAGVLSMFQFRSPSSTSSEDRWGAISSHMVSRAQLGLEGGLQQAATVRDLFLEEVKSRNSNCLGTDLDSRTELCRLCLQQIATPPPLAILSFLKMLQLGMEISEFLVVFLRQDSDTARTSGLAECAKAVNKTILGRRLLMLTFCVQGALFSFLAKKTYPFETAYFSAPEIRICI